MNEDNFYKKAEGRIEAFEKVKVEHSNITRSLVRSLPAIFFWAISRFDIPFGIKFYLLFAVVGFYAYEFFYWAYVFLKDRSKLKKNDWHAILNWIIFAFSLFTVIKILVELNINLTAWINNFGDYNNTRGLFN